MSAPTSTQQAHPVRASRRTAAQTVLSVILVLGVVAPIFAAILHEELSGYLPDRWLAWIAGAAALIAAVSAALARVMAIPAVDTWLRHLGLSSTPQRAARTPDGAHVITTLAEAVDVAAPEGYEVPEVSAAKDEVAEAVRDLLEYHLDDAETVYATPRDPIHEADTIVEKLLEIGWRPTATRT